MHCTLLLHSRRRSRMLLLPLLSCSLLLLLLSASSPSSSSSSFPLPSLLRVHGWQTNFGLVTTWPSGITCASKGDSAGTSFPVEFGRCYPSGSLAIPSCYGPGVSGMVERICGLPNPLAGRSGTVCSAVLTCYAQSNAPGDNELCTPPGGTWRDELVPGQCYGGVWNPAYSYQLWNAQSIKGEIPSARRDVTVVQWQLGIVLFPSIFATVLTALLLRRRVSIMMDDEPTLSLRAFEVSHALLRLLQAFNYLFMICLFGYMVIRASQGGSFESGGDCDFNLVWGKVSVGWFVLLVCTGLGMPLVWAEQLPLLHSKGLIAEDISSGEGGESFDGLHWRLARVCAVLALAWIPSVMVDFMGHSGSESASTQGGFIDLTVWICCGLLGVLFVALVGRVLYGCGPRSGNLMESRAAVAVLALPGAVVAVGSIVAGITNPQQSQFQWMNLALCAARAGYEAYSSLCRGACCGSAASDEAAAEYRRMQDERQEQRMRAQFNALRRPSSAGQQAYVHNNIQW